MLSFSKVYEADRACDCCGLDAADDPIVFLRSALTQEPALGPIFTCQTDVVTINLIEAISRFIGSQRRHLYWSLSTSRYLSNTEAGFLVNLDDVAPLITGPTPINSINKAKAISAKLLESNLKKSWKKQGEQDETRRNRKKHKNWKKLDGVGPVDNRLSTNKLHNFVRRKKM